MKEQYDFIAPTGDALQGTSELIPVAYGIDFTGPDPRSDFDHNGDNNEFDEAAVPIAAIGGPFFMDESGEDWPAHHLIPADAEPLSDETLRLFAIEIALGKALDAANASLGGLRGVLKVIGSETPETSELITLLTRYTERDRPKRPQSHGRSPSSLIDHLTVEYARAKSASIAAKDRELTAQKEASPRVNCDNCPWIGSERDCGEIQNLSGRVAPGEIMPAGECPECGALCHLTENEEA
jgi:hypothetical protein